MSASSEKQSSPSPIARTALKLGICGAVIFAIGFSIAVVGTSGTVSVSHADVAWFSPFERTNSERFETSLDKLGHDEPRRFNLNGNTVFFSTATSRKMPRQLMAEYQEEFRRQGLNDQIYVDLSAEQADARTFTSLTGGLVPLEIRDDQIVLGGVLTANKASTPQELMKNMMEADNPDDLFRAHRYIEITRSPDRRHTSIVSSWSDEAFDYSRMRPGSRAEGQIYDHVVPPCPGCTRLTRFADDNPAEADRVDLAFLGPRSIDETRDFYYRTLVGDGWVFDEVAARMEKLEEFIDLEVPLGEAMTFQRGNQQLTLIVMPDPRSGQTMTLATHTDA